ncbi:hypothetical protein [Gracilibacillus lacisalsi]|uniref:hypothetical protein n=1 Tax=Gracilibacillus lacisalsi TaxID=393087 RepID=UPI00037CF204|nr:hypothetical protein [Gracilibacillus lacisalsi]
MLNNLNEEYFLVLRRPLESKRQSPKSLGSILILSIFLQAFLLFLEFFVGGFSNYPSKDLIVKIHLIASSILATISVIYSIPYIYLRSQRVEYFVSMLVSQNLFGVSVYLISLMAVGTILSNEDSLLQFTYMTLLIGGIVIIITFVRFIILLNNGFYRKGSKKDKQRGKFEKTSYLPVVILIGISISFVIQFLIRNFNTGHYDVMFVIILSIVIFLVMLFILPEQLVILYYKFRFDSFNYELNGRLKPVKDENGKMIPEEKLDSYFRQKTKAGSE